MKVGEKEIEIKETEVKEIKAKEIKIKDLVDTIKCNRKIVEHVRKRQIEESSSSSKNKSQPQEHIMLSEQEKCFRTTLVRVGLFTFCSLGLGKAICESYDIIKDEEKKFGRKLSDYDVHQIVIDTSKKHGIISDNSTDHIL